MGWDVGRPGITLLILTETRDFSISCKLLFQPMGTLGGKKNEMD